ncbi:MAG: cellulase family glycosylhydrolase [Anaerolineaceae bacterium]|nr:cellulase family glycosylhydrolase [Anaerolineaceae bacterium]
MTPATLRWAGVGLFLLVLTVAVWLRRPPPDPLAATAVIDPPFTPLTYGIQTSLWWDDGFNGWRLDMVRLMVFSHVKHSFAWADTEPHAGDYRFGRADQLVDEIEEKGLQLVVRLGHSPEWVRAANRGPDGELPVDAPPTRGHLDNWGDWCGALASRYAGRIAAYQIWNEPNLAREWGGHPPSAADYTELLRVCSAAIRAADPQAILISAGLAPTGTCCEQARPDDLYLQELYDSGFQRHIDVVGMHAPGYSAPELGPDEAEAGGGQRFFTFRRVEDLRRIMVENGDAARQVAILETGWTRDVAGHNPAYSWFAVNEATQADYLVRAYRYAAEYWRPWVGLMTTLSIADPAWNEDDEQYWWSIILPDRHAVTGFKRLANMAKVCGQRVIPARDPDSPEAMGLAPVTPCR